MYPTSAPANVRSDVGLSRRPASRPDTLPVVADDDLAEQDERKISLQATLSRVVVRAMKELYGRGPTHAKTYFCDEYVFCVMSGGLTRSEETMIRGGEHGSVRDYRLRFQSVIAPELMRRVEDVLGRRVVNYHSQVLFDPDRIIEIFVLDPSENADRVQSRPPQDD
jgi:uncharacterized protein YbcI